MICRISYLGIASCKDVAVIGGQIPLGHDGGSLGNRTVCISEEAVARPSTPTLPLLEVLRDITSGPMKMDDLGLSI